MKVCVRCMNYIALNSPSKQNLQLNFTHTPTEIEVSQERNQE